MQGPESPPYREELTTTDARVPGRAPLHGGSALPSTTPRSTGLFSFTWDTVAGAISADPLGQRPPGPPGSPTRRAEREFLAEIPPAQLDSVLLRARAAQRTGQPLDIRLWVPDPEVPRGSSGSTASVRRRRTATLPWWARSSTSPVSRTA